MSRDLVWMDSGAFSAFTLGATIDLAAYAAWTVRWSEFMDYYAVLDVIGSAEGTYANQKKMEAMGSRPVPCFHYGEDPAWLLKYIEEGYEYIALGGMVPIETDQLEAWLDDLWTNYLTNEQGAPVVRVHGFGLTTMSLVSRYPWFSVDSSSWLATSANGTILFFLDGELYRVAVSEKSPKTGQAGQHFMTYPKVMQNRINAHLHKTTGYTVEQCASDYKARHMVNIQTYREAETARWGPRPLRLAQQTLWGGTAHGQGRPPARGWPWDRCQIYLAGWVTYAVEAEFWARNPVPRRMYSYHAMGKNQKMWATIMNHVTDQGVR